MFYGSGFSVAKKKDSGKLKVLKCSILILGMPGGKNHTVCLVGFYGPIFELSCFIIISDVLERCNFLLFSQLVTYILQISLIESNEKNSNIDDFLPLLFNLN